MRAILFLVAIIFSCGCAARPVLLEQDYRTSCKTPGACEALLRGKMMQYQQIPGMGGGIVVGVMPAPSAVP